jgi:hypothetical protein
MNLDHPDYRHPALERFAPLAAAYCAFIERHADFAADALLQEAHRHLAGLYAAGLALPSTDVLFDEDDETIEDDECETPPFDGPPDPDRFPSDEWMTLFRELGAQIGPANSYREIFDPYEPVDAEDAEEVTGSLADDLADVYADLRTGLLKWERGESGEALWEWRFGLDHHWGEHATGAMRALWARSAWHDTGVAGD